LLKQEASVVLIRDKAGAPYKALIPGDNHHMDIVEDPDGGWRGYAATVFEVNQRDFTPRWRTDLPGARLMFRLHKGDMVELADIDGIRRIKRVVRINPSGGRLYLAAHDEGGELAKRHDDPEDAFRWDLASVSKLNDRGCQLLAVDALGRTPSPVALPPARPVFNS
jgi:CRISPR-associated endonuclease Csn1